MKTIILFLFLSTALSAQTLPKLDSLVQASSKQMQRYKTLVSPEKLFAKMDTSKTTSLISQAKSIELKPLPVAPIVAPAPVAQLQSSVWQKYSDMDNRLRNLEINMAKVTTILDNMQQLNEKHTDKFDNITGILEAIITAISVIVAAFVGVYFQNRKKNKDQN